MIITSFISLILTRSDSIAFDAVTHIVVRLGIFLAVFVAVRAMCNCGGNHHQRCEGRKISFTTPQVLLKRYGFKVLRVHATADAAEVVNLQISRYRTFEKFMRDTMRFLHHVRIVVPQQSVATWVQSVQPQPATGHWFGRHPDHQSFFNGKLYSGHLISFKDRCLQAVETFARLAAFSILTQFSVKQWMRQQGSGA